MAKTISGHSKPKTAMAMASGRSLASVTDRIHRFNLVWCFIHTR